MHQDTCKLLSYIRPNNNRQSKLNLGYVFHWQPSNPVNYGTRCLISIHPVLTKLHYPFAHVKSHLKPEQIGIKKNKPR